MDEANGCYTLITNLMHWLLFIHKHCSPLHVSSIKCSSSGGHSCIQAAYGTVTLYKEFLVACRYAARV